MKPTEGYRRGQMATKKLTPAQEHAVTTIEVLTDDISTAKRVIKRQIEEEFERRVEDLKRKRSRACNEALALGVPKRRISSAINTSNWTTLNETLALTADEFTAEAAPVEVETPRGWTYNPDTMQVTVFEYEQRFTGKTITAEAEVLIPGEMQHTQRGYRVQPLRYPTDIEVQWVNDVFDVIGQEQGMMNAPQAPARAPEPDDDSASIEEQFWAQAGSENDDDEWDHE